MEEELQSGRQGDRLRKLLLCPFWVSSCLLLPLPPLRSSGSPLPLLYLSLGRGNLICSPQPSLPLKARGNLCIAAKRKRGEGSRSNEIILFADRMSVKINERIHILPIHPKTVYVCLSLRIVLV